MALKDLLETLGSIYIQGETVKAVGNQTAGNNPTDYPYVHTGVDSDGSTLVRGTLVPGVQNGALFAGVGLLLMAGLALYFVAAD